MSHGGKRQGSGRKVGSVTKRTREIADKAIKEGVTPLEVMVKIMNDALAIQDIPTALDAAKSAAPYIHPRLQAVEHSGKDGGDIGHRLTISWMTEEEAKKRGWA